MKRHYTSSGTFEAYSKTIRDCFDLADLQKRKGCMGNSESEFCKSNCLIYSERLNQCKGKVATDNCDFCSLRDYYLNDVNIGKLCALRKRQLDGE